jgi:hypothetical protein
MANDEHVALINQGVAAWNAWRDKNLNILHPDLDGANLTQANLRGANLRGANLNGAYLMEANLDGANLNAAILIEAYLGSANLNWADLGGAKLNGAHLYRANLNGAYLYRANLDGADLDGANLTCAALNRADIRGANLEAATLVSADLTGADLTGCRIHGVSAWRLKLDTETKQQNLVITRSDEPEITVDNIEVAQFIYLMLNNQKVRDVIDTITSKAVLILGRFTNERKAHQCLRGLGSPRAEY